MDNQEQDISELIKEAEKAKEEKSTFKKIAWNFFNFLKTIALIVILAFIIRMFIIQPFIVEGQSMEPAFHDRDYLITEKISFHFHEPLRGDIIIFHPPNSPRDNYIKRVIGVPGDMVNIKDGSVYVNGQKLNETYLPISQQTIVSGSGEIDKILGTNEFYVLGDNRSHSRDSRDLGPITRDRIVSHVWFRLYPLNQIRAFAAVNYQNSY